jgi:hypothetical protein
MASREGLAEPHTHLGGSVATEIMWTLAHEQRSRCRSRRPLGTL